MWRPIETAPQDGSLFLALCGRTASTWRIEHRPAKRSKAEVGIWPFRKTVETVEQEEGFYLENVTDGGGIFYVHSGRMFGLRPTHWMPLPEPPQ